MKYKGFRIPWDFHLFLFAVYKIVQYLHITRQKAPDALMEHIGKKGRYGYNRVSDTNNLIKLYRLINFILIRLIRYKRPCMIRSCILYEAALKMRKNTELIFAVKKEDDKLLGHSWISIDGKPFMESNQNIKDYTVMLKG